jgi:predicted transcriptional regulator
VRRIREELLLTKAELARKAGVSALTVTRVEAGLGCRVDTMRKIILALGLQPTDRQKVFGNLAARRAVMAAPDGRKEHVGVQARGPGLARRS